MLTDFIERWNRTRFAEGGISAAGTGYTFNWHEESPGARFHHSVLLRTTAGVPQYDETALLKTVGHFLLSKMPDEGIIEALEGLAETYTYWNIRTQELTESHPAVSSLHKAVQGSSYVRPTFRVSEE